MLLSYVQDQILDLGPSLADKEEQRLVVVTPTVSETERLLTVEIAPILSGVKVMTLYPSIADNLTEI